MKSILAVPAVIVAMLAAPAARQSPLADLLARAGNYVLRFQRDLATIVAEEQYTQTVIGGTPLQRELKSDILLLRPSGTNRYVQYRDVFEVDGRAVHARGQRPFAVGTQLSSASMAEIVTESARYNIGDIERTINVPVLPLTFLLPDNQWRFKFSLDQTPPRESERAQLPASPHFTVSTEVWVVSYREVEHPTIIRSIEGKDVPARGRFWIEPSSGRVLMSELVAEDRSVHSKIDVSYQSEPVLDCLVPIDMREVYWRNGAATRIEGAAVYTTFRPVDAAR